MYSDSPLGDSEEILYTGRVSMVAYTMALLTLLLQLAMGGFNSLPASEITVTNKRVFGKRGMIWRRRFDVPFSQIVHVWIQQGMLGMLFNYGTLIVYTQADKKIKLKAISEPSYVKHLIEEAIETKMLGHTLAQYTREEF